MSRRSSYDPPNISPTTGSTLSDTEAINSNATENEVSVDNVALIDFQILGSIKALLLYGPMGPEMINDIAKLYNVSADTVKEVVKRMRV